MSEFVKWLWRESCGVKRYVTANAVCGIVSVGCSLWFVWVTKHIVDMATHRSEGEWWTAVAMLACALALQLCASVAGRRSGVMATTRFSNNLRGRMFERLMKAEWTGKERFHSGDAVNRLAGDVGAVSGLVGNTVPGAVVTVTQLVGAFGFMLLLDARLAWVLVAVMPVALVCSKLYMKRSRELTRAIRGKESGMQRIMQEDLQHRVLISSMGYTDGAAGEFRAAQRGFYRLVMKRNDIALFSSSAVTVGFMTGYAVAFLWCAMGLYSGGVTFGAMTAFLQLVSRVQRPVVELAGCVPAVVHAGVAVERLEEILRLPEEEHGADVKLRGPVGLRLSYVGFAYPESERGVLCGVSHDFKPCTMTVIAGSTGAGKTTLLMLMLGLLKPQTGEVQLYDGERSVDASPLSRGNICYVPQGNSLLSGTVRSNLLMAKPDASEAEMEEALRKAAAEFVLELPQGLDTECGERGSGLSEGQAQRIAIARGLLQSGRVLLLDEPSSALDAATERRLMENLEAESAHRTVIVVSHSPKLIGMVPIVVRL